MYIFDYIWEGEGGGTKLCSKTCISKENIPGEIHHDTLVLIPRRTIFHPSKCNAWLVLCDTWIYNNENELMPCILSNKRHFCTKELKLDNKNQVFEFQQDFYIFDVMKRPFGVEGVCISQNNKCRIGNGHIVGRPIIDTVLKYCIDIGINVTESYCLNGFSQWCVKVKSTHWTF